MKFYYSMAIAILILVSAVAITYAAPKQDKKITITLSEQDWNIVLEGLADMPLKKSQPVYLSIIQQAQSQLQPAVKRDSATKIKTGH